MKIFLVKNARKLKKNETNIDDKKAKKNRSGLLQQKSAGEVRNAISNSKTLFRIEKFFSTEK